MPPPPVAEFPEIVEVEIVRTPALLKAPPKPEVKFAPDTVTPEIKRKPPVETEKTLKSRLLPLMLIVFAPGPVMVRVPAVEAFAMAGSTPVRDIVAGPLVKSEGAKTMVSLVG